MFQRALETAERCGVDIHWGWDAYTENVTNSTGKSGVIVYAGDDGEFVKALRAFTDAYLETGQVPDTSTLTKDVADLKAEMGLVTESYFASWMCLQLSRDFPYPDAPVEVLRAEFFRIHPHLVAYSKEQQ